MFSKLLKAHWTIRYPCYGTVFYFFNKYLIKPAASFLFQTKWFTIPFYGTIVAGVATLCYYGYTQYKNTSVLKYSLPPPLPTCTQGCKNIYVAMYNDHIDCARMFCEDLAISNYISLNDPENLNTRPWEEGCKKTFDACFNATNQQLDFDVTEESKEFFYTTVKRTKYLNPDFQEIFMQYLFQIIQQVSERIQENGVEIHRGNMKDVLAYILASRLGPSFMYYVKSKEMLLLLDSYFHHHFQYHAAHAMTHFIMCNIAKQKGILHSTIDHTSLLYATKELYNEAPSMLYALRFYKMHKSSNYMKGSDINNLPTGFSFRKIFNNFCKDITNRLYNLDTTINFRHSIWNSYIVDHSLTESIENDMEVTYEALYNEKNNDKVIKGMSESLLTTLDLQHENHINTSINRIWPDSHDSEDMIYQWNQVPMLLNDALENDTEGLLIIVERYLQYNNKSEIIFSNDTSLAKFIDNIKQAINATKKTNTQTRFLRMFSLYFMALEQKEKDKEIDATFVSRTECEYAPIFRYNCFRTLYEQYKENKDHWATFVSTHVEHKLFNKDICRLLADYVN